MPDKDTIIVELTVDFDGQTDKEAVLDAVHLAAKSLPPGYRATASTCWRIFEPHPTRQSTF